MPASPEIRTALLESDLLDALMVPARQGEFARDSRAFVRLDTSLRAYWHTLFDICPELLSLSGPDGLAIFRPFMAWAAERQLSMNWTYYLWVHRWLQQSPFADRLSPQLTLSLMAASAARWAMGDRGPNGGIALGSAELPELVVAWKCHTVTGGREVECLSLEEPLPPPEGGFGWFTLPGFELDNFPGWSPIPQ